MSRRVIGEDVHWKMKVERCHVLIYTEFGAASENLWPNAHAKRTHSNYPTSRHREFDSVLTQQPYVNPPPALRQTPPKTTTESSAIRQGLHQGIQDALDFGVAEDLAEAFQAGIGRRLDLSMRVVDYACELGDDCRQ